MRNVTSTVCASNSVRTEQHWKVLLGISTLHHHKRLRPVEWKVTKRPHYLQLIWCSMVLWCSVVFR